MNITNEKIEKAFENTRFGTTDYRGLIQTALIDVAKGYSTGYTIAQVCKELGLIIYNEREYRLTDKGWDYMRDFERRSVLTSLLEELPEVEDDTHNDYNLGIFNGQEAYRDQIIALIQSKL